MKRKSRLSTKSKKPADFRLLNLQARFPQRYVAVMLVPLQKKGKLETMIKRAKYVGIGQDNPTAVIDVKKGKFVYTHM